jgi:hypothetical protein
MKQTTATINGKDYKVVVIEDKEDWKAPLLDEYDFTVYKQGSHFSEYDLETEMPSLHEAAMTTEPTNILAILVR